MNFIKIVGLVAVIALAGCKANDMYYWGSYESTLYQYQKEPTEDNLTKHKQQLETIISKSSDKKPVPPGIYFELGMLEAQEGDTQRSIELLTLEKEKFPEATAYVDLALARVGDK